MALEIRQQLKLSQQLVMTPQLQQAIKLLQLSRMELVELVQQELEENPVLEETLEQAELPEQELAEPGAGDLEVTVPDESDKVQEVKGEEEGLSDIDWQTYLDGYTAGGSAGEHYYDDDDERPSFENLLTRTPSLADHLLWQVNLSHMDDSERRIAAEIIGNLDDDGYFQATLDEVSAATGASPEQVLAALVKVQDLDPPGIASRNLQECLLKQVEALEMRGSLVESMLRNYLPELEVRKYQHIAKSLDVSLDEVLTAAKVISNLDPRPGRQFNQDEVHYISPDIFVHKIGDEYVVMLNDEGLPNLRINSFYRNALTGATPLDDKAGEYIQEKMRGALWLIKSIHQRQRTIYKVTRSIVKFQRAFFDDGIAYLKPLVLRDVAEDIQMHESTISRVTTNKYVQTPQGLFELKYFFNSGIHTSDGDSVASESVKSKIREIITAENSRKPYSDQKIVEILRDHNIDIARRTVTKYREMMNIGSSTQRKRLF